ncbi:MAG TPA: hypothetical protein VIP77_02800 [Jiangellaceae bacterium]
MQQINLFPLSALKTEGFAQPEPRDDETVTDEDTVDEPEAEAA